MFSLIYRRYILDTACFCGFLMIVALTLYQSPSFGGWVSPESGVDPPDAPPPCNGCACDAAGGNGPPGNDPDSTAASTGYPIHLMNGSVVESVADIHVPGPLGGWAHRRSYNSLLSTFTYENPNYLIHGRRWVGGGQAMYLCRNGNTMELYLNASSRRVFTDNNPGQSNGTYTGPPEMNATLTKSVELGYLVYTLAFPDSGNVFIFREKDPLDPCWGISAPESKFVRLVERTNLAYLTQGLAGEKYFYNSSGQLILVVTASPQSYCIQYTYLTTGAVAGRLKKIEVFDGTPSLPNSTKIAQVEYNYVGDGVATTAIGVNGDLTQVKVSELLSDGVTWEHKYTQYRHHQFDWDVYYHYPLSNQSGNTYGHYQLKSVYESDAIERIVQENANISSPEDLLSKTDNTVLTSGNAIAQYASRTFDYYFGFNPTPTFITAWGSETFATKYGGSPRVTTITNPHLGLVRSETVNSGCA
jgi:hypothetical protein